jgi:hypothetical protein
MTRRLALAGLLAVVAIAIYAAIRAHRDLTDFEVYRTAAARAAHGEPLYRADDGHYQFKYLPAFAVVTRPLASMPAETAKRLWFALSFGLIVAFVWTAVRGLPERRLSQLAVTAWVVAIMAKFFVRELALGQTNVLLAVLLLPALVRPSRRPWLAGIATGAAIFVKPYAALLLPWMAFRQPRAIPGVAIAVAVGLLVPAATYGWSGNLALLADWAHTVTETTAPNLLHPDNVSLASMWAKWTSVGLTATALAAVSALALLAEACWTWFRTSRVRDAAFLEVGVLMLLMPLLSPQGWDYVLLLGMPVVAAVVDRWHALPSHLRAYFVLVAVVFATPIRLFMSVDAYNAVMATAVVSVAAIVLVGLGTSLRARGLL